MKKNVKRTLSLLLAALMILALSACGESNVEETAAPEFVYKADYKEVKLPDEVDYFYPNLVTSSAFYGTVSVKTGERELEPGEELLYDGQLDVYEQRLFRMDFNGEITPLEGYVPFEVEQITWHDRSAYTSRIVERAEGGFFEKVNVSDYWNDSKIAALEKLEKETGTEVDPDSVTDLVYDPESWRYENKIYIRVLDEDGAPLRSIELDTAPVAEFTGYEYFDLYSIVQADADHILASGDGGLFVYDVNSGEMTGHIDGVDYADNLISLRDGRIVSSYYGDSGQKLAVIDTAAGKVDKEFNVQGDLYRMCAGGGDYDVYYNNGVNFIGFDLDAGDKGEAVKLFNWINCDVDNSNISNVLVTDDGRIVAASNEWDNETGRSTCYLISMDKVSSDTLPQKEVLTFATQYLQWEARGEIIRFNRSHDNIRIELKDYSEFNTEEDYEAGLTKLRTEMLAGNCPDIIDLNGLPARQMAAKGLLADLYPLIDADPELNREDFFPNVLRALENNGRLYATCSSFEVVSALGKSSVFGTEPGVSFAELRNVLADQADGCTVFDPYMTRYDVLQTCLMVDLDYFVDWNTGSVRFDSPEFVELLKFSASFPAEFDWENYEWTREDDENFRVRDDKQLLIRSWLYDFNNLVQYENLFGGLDGFTFVGLPTSEGVGSMLYLSSGYAICDKCRNKEAAWEFIRMYMTENYQNNNAYDFPSNLHSYQKRVENAMQVSYVTDENGKILIDPETGEKWKESKGGYYDPVNDEYVEIYSYNADEIAKIEDVITSASRVYNQDTTINGIVSEQVEAFFAGQRSAEDVAKLIQSKVMLYVNEQR